MRYPTTDRRVSSPYGYRVHPVTGISTLHAGADFPHPGLGAPLLAVAEATVVSSGYSSGGGNWVTLRLPDGVLATYFHMQHPTMRPTGHGVSEAETVGYMGSTGEYTTGPHLHFETRRADGSSFDPIPYLDQGIAAGGDWSPFPDAEPAPIPYYRKPYGRNTKERTMIAFRLVDGAGKLGPANKTRTYTIGPGFFLDTTDQPTANAAAVIVNGYTAEGVAAASPNLTYVELEAYARAAGLTGDALAPYRTAAGL